VPLDLRPVAAAGRFPLRGAALAVVVCLASPASAQPAKAQCVFAAEEGQRLRAQGKLREALARFTSCASDACPVVVRTDCVGWRAEVDAAVPTVVVRAVAAEDPGRELYDVQVSIDGVPVTEKLDGGELPVNPGEHHVTFKAAERTPVTDSVVVRVGEKHRLLTVALPSTHPPAVIAPPPLPAPRPRVGTPARILLGASAVALATSAGFGLSGWLSARSLRSSCSPTCDQADVDAIRTRLRVADISLGVGVAALAAAGWLIWRRPGEKGVSVAVVPVSGGALLGVTSGRSP
jgi:hypothetical protein